MDWDGTTSMGRGGWGEIMTDVYVENLPLQDGETDESRRQYSWDELMPLNGKPAIHQMEHLVKLMVQRGGKAQSADAYQAEFQRRLLAMVFSRMEAIRTGQKAADSILIPGVCTLLAELRKRSIGLTLCTGTPIEQVTEEARLLGIDQLFDSIRGPADLEDRTFSKRGVIQEILKLDGMDGSALLSIGDGPAEIVEAKAVGGLTIGVASDEKEFGSGRVDEWKRGMLLEVGADAIIPDFSSPHELLKAVLE